MLTLAALEHGGRCGCAKRKRGRRLPGGGAVVDHPAADDGQRDRHVADALWGTRGPQSVRSKARRVTACHGITVQLTAVDSCGEWPTFVGGGPSAF